VPDVADLRDRELTFDEIRQIVDQARAMGCQAWGISGGEPMLRPDFAEIFEYISRNALTVKINTNGALITPKIARLLARSGKTMVALYGATAEVFDHITRTPGSFEATMRGIQYLKEAGTQFTVQIVPMRDNFHEYEQMLTLAETLSDDIRVGAAWLWLSADHNPARNREIIRQRLDPEQVLQIDMPGAASHILAKDQLGEHQAGAKDDFLFGNCIPSRRDFHIDPYGQMSFCYYVKDPALRYDLRQGTFQEAWEEFIPSLAGVVRGGQEYQENCGACTLRGDCRWCAVYSYLEHGRYSAKIDYLCQVAAATRRYKENWRLTHLRYYQIAGLTLSLSADFPITDGIFSAKFEKFRVDKPGDETLSIKLVTGVPKLSELNLGKEIYRKPPWAIYQQANSFVYRGIASEEDYDDPRSLAIVNGDYSQMTICRESKIYDHLSLQSLTTFVSDQILLAPALAHRQAFYMHSSAMVINGKGLLFVGHSEVGKSTMIKMLRGQGEILCDDRNIVRRWPDGFHVHGTWSPGELPDISPAGAPLRAVLFLEQAQTNELILIDEKSVRLGKVLSHLVKGVETEEWWDKVLTLAGEMVKEVPMYRLKFDKSGKVIEVLQELLQ
jgi:MoaA/NifB/PqqE/SkfB family radical SAM enzyme